MTTAPGNTRTLDRNTDATMRPVRLVVLHGKDLGHSFVLERGTAVIGTRSDCQLVLTDEHCSRRHCSVEVTASGLRVSDLGSKNGVFHLGAKLSQVELEMGAVIDIGRSRIGLLPVTGADDALCDQMELLGLVGRSPAMKTLYRELVRLADSDAAVFIHGETGTGKDLVARALHALSRRSNKPLEVFDCAATKPELLHSAFFGHQQGAFTGAVKDQTGALERANGGTLFLDEIAELPLDLQATVFRALETGTFSRLGETSLRTSSFRLVSASNVSLEQAAKAGRFRPQLLHRVAAMTIEVPPLRERFEDLPLLALRFAEAAGKPFRLSESAIAQVSSYGWPGNVRELKNYVERAVLMGEQPAAEPGLKLDFHEGRERAIAAFEKSYLELLLEQYEGKADAAAKAAGLSRSYFYRLVETHGLLTKRKRKR